MASDRAVSSGIGSLFRGLAAFAAVGALGVSGAWAAPVVAEEVPPAIAPVDLDEPETGGPGNPVCDGDFNGDGVINYFDVVDFIQAYLNQDPAADIAPPFGVWNFLDIQLFIVRIRVGCPTP